LRKVAGEGVDCAKKERGGDEGVWGEKHRNHPQPTTPKSTNQI